MPACLLIAQVGADTLPLAQRWWLFAGKLHPMTVHFPIALLIVAALMEMVRRRRGEARYVPSPAATTCLTIGAMSAIAAAAMGWSDAITSGHSDQSVLLHRWLGVLAAALATLAMLAAMTARWRKQRRAFAAYRAIILLAALCVGAAGHFGAALVHGESYIGNALAMLRGRTMTASGSDERARATSQAAGVLVAFASDVRPIFARRCFSCHSGSEPAGGLNLDDRASLLAGGKSRTPAVTPGDAAQSRLIALVTHGESDLIMPPKGARLDQDQVAIIARWIDEGANWATIAASNEHWHWAYQPPQRPNAPPVINTNWPRNPIDQFILARLESEGLAPAPPADRDTLLRRVSLDLIGLPPSPRDVGDFLGDSSPHAYERAVDRLLASPHYGERWARMWLDLARYADTHGYEKDDRRVMWPWRDWVINAFNADMPFDRFTIEQLAGDALPNPSLDQLIATGFNRNSMINEEGGVDPEEFRVEAVIDRVNTYAGVWLGSTLACAQCHDHKYDPFPQRDYYSLYAFFNQDEADATRHATGATAGGPMVDVPSLADRAAHARVRAEIAALEARLEPIQSSVSRDAALARWEAVDAKREPAWLAATPTRVAASEGTILQIGDDGMVVATGDVPQRDTYIIELALNAEIVHALRLEVFPDDSTPAKAVGRSPHGNIVLSDVRIEVFGDDGQPAREVAIMGAVADFEQPRTFGGGGFWPIADAIDGDERSGGWALGPQTQQAHVAVFQLDQPVARAGNGPICLRVTLAQNYGGQHTIARFRLSATGDADVLAARSLSPEIRAILDVPAAQRASAQRTQVAAYFDTISPEIAPFRAKLLTLRRELNALTAARAMVMRQADHSRETFVHVGGNFLNHGERVEPTVPAVLGQLPPASLTAPRDRLALAKWTVDPVNPLAARVAVNRLWEQVFGRGIVVTSDDFGTQGEPPSHLQLLDWLATEFVRGGWSVKDLLKLIVMSETYRQCSIVTPQMLERDPQNILLARGPRFRVDAETVRDIALASSGLLVSRVGGPSVFPPQPDGIWSMIYSSDQWKNSTGDDAHRRGLYTFWRRTAPYPSFVTFDAPSRELACTRRPRTNTPLQALTTLNDPAFVEAANALAKRIMSDGGNDARSRITFGFIACVGRSPTESEIETVTRLLEDQRTAYASDVPSAETLSGTQGDAAVDLAAWQVVANVLLNLDETITKE